MKTATLDLTGCKYLGEIHQRIKETLNFPDYYYENWSAFWDCLNMDCDIEFLTVTGLYTLPKKFYESIIKFKEILERNKKHWADSDQLFDYEIID